MLRAALAALAVAALAGPPSAAAAGTPDRPRYDVDLRSDATGAHWTGSGSASFRNAGRRPLERVYLRLWGNGPAGCARPAVRVTLQSGGEAGDLEVDCTALRITLDAPVPAGGRGKIAFDLRIDVPFRDDRFGRKGKVVALGNALPILAIDDGDGPRLDPYTTRGESFYSQLGSFDVTLDAPTRLALPATGTLAGARRAPGGRRVRRYVATRVRDFAWVAAPMRRKQIRTPAGVQVVVWQLLGRPGEDMRQALLTAEVAMTRYAQLFGPYPYPEVDIVLMDFAAFGGMEYPTLVLANASPVVIAHELAHQWWYGIIGNDPWREPWLDETLATWASSEAIGSDAAGVDCSGPPVFPDDAAALTSGMDYWDGHTGYGQVVYRDGACLLVEIEGRIGHDRFLAALARYARAHRFGWSRGPAFVAALEAAAARDPGVSIADLWTRYRVLEPARKASEG
jgi:Peptidase family M1 domain